MLLASMVSCITVGGSIFTYISPDMPSVDLADM